ncbi:rhodanese-like domain-containing protein, partial [Undibacterium sp. Rencai35W]|uniref:rhodanese-like domain-containing protein n=1 Tax=Undibacterium sp. Rencai35W TaxID=3413046 RepID=UPI003BF38472
MLAIDDVYLIDTREPYEHGANNVSQQLAINPARVMNIPLSRMANALVDGQLSSQGKYILLCRSGNRSKQAATNLSQLGFTNVYNLSGGMA